MPPSACSLAASSVKRSLALFAVLLALAGLAVADPWGTVEYVGDSVARLNGAQYNEVTAPGAAPANRVELYAKADGLLYSKDDAGLETLVSSGQGGWTVGIPAAAGIHAPADVTYPGRETLANSGKPTLAFDGANDEDVLYWDVTLPAAYVSTSNVTFEIVICCDTNASQQTVWTIEFDRLETADIDAALTFDTAQSLTCTTSGSVGVATTHAWTLANGDMDAPAAGDLLVIRVTRDANNAADTSVVDVHLVALRMYQ